MNLSLMGRLALVCLAAVSAFAQTTPEPPKLEPLKQSITVNADIAAEAPASIVEIGRPQLQQLPGENLDDRLRYVPGFSMFRRSSSLAANPTTQGISLRGLGSSGASRTLLLWDGIPVNSPFGGWIYWDRLAPEDIERIEISRGASTSIFGDKAMGGSINIFSRPPEPWRLQLGVDGGNDGQVQLYGGFSHLWRNRFGASAHIRTYRMDGYYIVPEGTRGPVDQPAGVEFVAGTIRFDYLALRDKLFLRLDTLAEDRRNGTALTPNSTGLGSLAASWAHDVTHDGLNLSAYHTRENYHAWFSSIGAGRRTETLSFMQHAPSDETGVAGLWRHTQSTWTTIAGGDFARTAGYSADYLLPTGLRFGEGDRWSRGFFGQVNGKTGPLTLFLGGREDFTGQGNSFFSPSGGVTAGRGIFRVRASAYRSFRSPTLNELYRTFRAGNAVTQSNAALLPEKLFGAEAGFDVVGETRRLSVTLFRNGLDDVITNVTLSTTPSLTTRQRQNAASAVTHGIEANLRQILGAHWQGELSYLYADSRYATGLRIPQVAKQQGSASVTWMRGKTFLSSSLRAYSLQFEDDLNTLVLPGYAVLQFSARQNITASLSARFEMENALDRVFLTGRTPAPQIGAPRLYRVGLRWDGPVR
jgi:outer membrane receptor protein involved in Fe transport